MIEGRSVRDRDRVVALASPRPGVLGLIALMDPDGRAATTDVVALEHGATVLAVSRPGCVAWRTSSCGSAVSLCMTCSPVPTTRVPTCGPKHWGVTR